MLTRFSQNTSDASGQVVQLRPHDRCVDIRFNCASMRTPRLAEVLKMHLYLSMASGRIHPLDFGWLCQQLRLYASRYRLHDISPGRYAQLVDIMATSDSDVLVHFLDDAHRKRPCLYDYYRIFHSVFDDEIVKYGHEKGSHSYDVLMTAVSLFWFATHDQYPLGPEIDAGLTDELDLGNIHDIEAQPGEITEERPSEAEEVEPDETRPPFHGLRLVVDNTSA